MRLTDKGIDAAGQRLNVTIPQTHYIGDARSLERLYPILKVSVVLKPYRSKIWANGRCTAASVKYANSLRQLKNCEQYELLPYHPFLLQEYISGMRMGSSRSITRQADRFFCSPAPA